MIESLGPSHPMLLDGGLATELERRGHDLNDPLWSARVLLEAPEAIRDLHRDYLESGARVIITASYQASFEGFAHRGLEEAAAKAAFRRCVELAKEARACYLPNLPARGTPEPLVAASIGPLGAIRHDGSEYRGDYGVTKKELVDFHARRIDALLEAEPDLFACETIPTLIEAEAICAVLGDRPGTRAWLSFTCRDETRTSAGEPLEEAAALAESEGTILAVGVNCVPPRLAPPIIDRLQRATTKPIVVYPNSGESWDENLGWHGDNDPASFAGQATAWARAGAALIGGCCRTGPEHIRAIRRAFARMGTLMLIFAIVVFTSTARGDLVRRKPPAVQPVGEPNSLRDRLGNPWRLEDFKNERAVVLLFARARSIPSNAAAKSLAELEARFRRDHIAFAAVYSHPADNPARAALDASEQDMPFLVLWDKGGGLARRLEVDVLPSLVVLSMRRVLWFRENWFALFRQRGKASPLEPIARMLDAVVAGGEITPSIAPTVGARPEPYSANVLLPPATSLDGKPVPTPTTFDVVAPILARRCAGCHRAGGIGPFALESYSDVVERARTIAEAIADWRMPAWHASPDPLVPLANSRELDATARAMLLGWLAAGCPRGTGEARIPSSFSGRFQMGEPDVMIESPTETTIAADSGPMPYQLIEIPPAVTEKLFAEERWLRAAEALPSDRSVVHHLQVFFFRPGERLAVDNHGGIAATFGWVPGEPSYAFPEGTAVRIPAHARMLWEVHYTPTGKATRDRPSVGLQFAPGPPSKELFLKIMVALPIEIPPGDPNYAQERRGEFQRPARIHGVLPHMHFRGKSFQLLVDGLPVLSVPRYDFDWQTLYWFRRPIDVKAGAEIVAAGRWDNSRYNARNPDPDATVHFGTQSSDEMLTAWVYFTTDSPVSSADQVLAQRGWPFEGYLSWRERPWMVPAVLVGAVAALIALFGAIRAWRRRREIDRI